MRFARVAPALMVLLCASVTAHAQTAGASSTDDIIEAVQSLCLDTGLNATKAWKAATDAGWVKVPRSVIDPHLWGIKPHYRVGTTSQDGPGLLLILSAQGQITSDQRRRFQGGLITEGSPVKRGEALSNPLMTEPSDTIGTKDCRLEGKTEDPYSLRNHIEALEINGAPFKQDFDHWAFGEGPDIGKYKHNTRWEAPNAVINLGIGKMGDDGSYPFSLILGSRIPIDSEPSSYLVKVD